VKCLSHNTAQFLYNLLLRPEILHQTLYPLEVGNGNATRVRQDIRNQKDVIFIEDPASPSG